MSGDDDVDPLVARARAFNPEIGGLMNIIGPVPELPPIFDEEQFFASVQEAFRYGARIDPMMVITCRELDIAHRATAAAEEFADQVYGEWLRHSRGWRRVRMIHRLTIARRYIDASRNAHAMRATFGYPA